MNALIYKVKISPLVYVLTPQREGALKSNGEEISIGYKDESRSKIATVFYKMDTLVEALPDDTIVTCRYLFSENEESPITIKEFKTLIQNR